MMEKYRKFDSYYEDQYDRETIEILKQLEKNSKVPLMHPERIIRSAEGSKILLEIAPQYDPFSPFYDKAVFRAQYREKAIFSDMQRDENKDRLVMHNRMPEIVKCQTCNCRMNFCTHFFRDEETRILFVFECPKGHLPKRILYPNGDEYYFRKRKCNICGSEDLKSSSKKSKKTLTCTEKCNECGEVTVDVFDLTFKPEEPIAESDRIKYCLDFKNKKTFMQGLEAIAEFGKHYQATKKEQKIREEYNVADIEKINVPQLEERLIKLTEENKFKKFQFQTPKMGRNVTVEFTVQDASSRIEKESKKLLERIIQEHLFKTNWRLFDAKNIHYRLGIINGKLKAHESDEDLLILAKQIKDGKKI